MKRTFLFWVFLLATSPVFAGGSYQVEADIGVTLDYVFADSPDHFVVKYTMKLEGEAEGPSAVLKGDGSVKSLVVGFYSKWDSGGCALNVVVEDVPFEMNFAELEENRIRLGLKHDKFTELWYSTCTFHDKPGTRFTTGGEREEWFAKGLERAFSRLKDLRLPLDPGHLKPTTFNPTIESFTVEDEAVGEAEVSVNLLLKVSPANTP